MNLTDKFILADPVGNMFTANETVPNTIPLRDDRMLHRGMSYDSNGDSFSIQGDDRSSYIDNLSTPLSNSVTPSTTPTKNHYSNDKSSKQSGKSLTGSDYSPMDQSHHNSNISYSLIDLKNAKAMSEQVYADISEDLSSSDLGNKSIQGNETLSTDYFDTNGINRPDSVSAAHLSIADGIFPSQIDSKQQYHEPDNHQITVKGSDLDHLESSDVHKDIADPNAFGICSFELQDVSISIQSPNQRKSIQDPQAMHDLILEGRRSSQESSVTAGFFEV